MAVTSIKVTNLRYLPAFLLFFLIFLAGAQSSPLSECIIQNLGTETVHSEPSREMSALEQKVEKAIRDNKRFSEIMKSHNPDTYPEDPSPFEVPENLVREYYRALHSKVKSYSKRDLKAEADIKIAVHNMLKHIFYPFTQKASADVKLLPKEKIQQITSEFLKDLKVRELNYEVITGRIQVGNDFKEDGIPFHVAAVGPLMNAPLADSLIKKNAWEGNPRYKDLFLNSDPNVRYADSYIFAEPYPKFQNDYGDVFQVLGATVTPIGGYGKEFAQSLLRTTQAFMYLVNQNTELRHLAEKTFLVNKGWLIHMTARGKGADRIGSRLSPAATLEEGIVSLHQFFSLILDSKIPGAETGRQALHDVIFDGANQELGLTSEFTSRLPMGLIGPMTLSGLRFKAPLQRLPNGRLDLSEPLKQVLKDQTKVYTKDITLKSRCPMSSLWQGSDSKAKSIPNPHEKADPAGLQLLAEAYWHVFEAVNSH